MIPIFRRRELRQTFRDLPDGHSWKVAEPGLNPGGPAVQPTPLKAELWHILLGHVRIACYYLYFTGAERGLTNWPMMTELGRYPDPHGSRAQIPCNNVLQWTCLEKERRKKLGEADRHSYSDTTSLFAIKSLCFLSFTMGCLQTFLFENCGCHCWPLPEPSSSNILHSFSREEKGCLLPGTDASVAGGPSGIFVISVTFPLVPTTGLAIL